jgi:hypothetical protein
MPLGEGLLGDWIGSRGRRGETRSIDPDSPV